MLQSEHSLGIAAFLLAIGYFVKKRYENPLSSLPLPPGPRGYPIIGNLLDIPSKFEWETYHKWSKELATDVLYLNVAGTPIVVLDTAEAVTELLERKSTIYSDRPRLPMVRELMGWDFLSGFIPYGEYWRNRRKHRRVMHDAFNPEAVRRFRPHTITATHGLLRRFLSNSDDIIGNIRQMVGETIIAVAYGIKIKENNDPYMKTAEAALASVVVAAVPGTFLVDIFPILKYVPEWVPGAGFKKKAREWKKLARSMLDAPYEAAVKEINSRTAVPSLVYYSLEKMEQGTDDAFQENIIKEVAGTLYAGGLDTTVCAMASGILGLLKNRDAYKKARAEVDSIVSPGHLPDFEDMDSMPYMTAVVMETMRWRDVAPIAIPRLLKVDDVYKGYRIPRGSIIIPNAWAMLHNDEDYPDPFTFNPDRFMKDGKINKEVKDPCHACFGFGRRLCPGRFMAFSSVWMMMVSLIATFNIDKAVDSDGNVIEPDPEYVSALAVGPKPWKCSITTRSREMENLISSTSN